MFDGDAAVAWRQFGTPQEAGLRYDRPKGKNHCVMRMTVSPALGG